LDEKLHELRRRLDQKTTEIETIVAAERGIGSIHEMDPSAYERLQQDVEELLGQEHGRYPTKQIDSGAF
jgi:hypothetical protein